MNETKLAHEVLDHVGGARNVVASTLCMTRLRVDLLDPTLVNRDALCAAHGVLGCTRLGDNGIEVILGPTDMRGVYDAFSGMAGTRTPSRRLVGGMGAKGNFHVQVVPPSDASDRRTPPSSDAGAKDDPDAALLGRLASLLDEDVAFAVFGTDERQEGAADGERRLLVINGPNINLLGIREPGIYGTDSFASLIDHCKRAATQAGFALCRCFQSNHEGDLVDAIQSAYGTYHGIVINPGAYTHTSVALFDALKAVGIPTVEVHISELSSREAFRQVSYLRAACIGTVAGEGVAGYGHAIRMLADHLGMAEATS